MTDGNTALARKLENDLWLELSLRLDLKKTVPDGLLEIRKRPVQDGLLVTQSARSATKNTRRNGRIVLEGVAGYASSKRDPYSSRNAG